MKIGVMLPHGWDASDAAFVYRWGPWDDGETLARRLFAGLPLQTLSEKNNIDEARARARKQPARHMGDCLKRVFFKNALYEVIARRV